MKFCSVGIKPQKTLDDSSVKKKMSNSLLPEFNLKDLSHQGISAVSSYLSNLFSKISNSYYEKVALLVSNFDNTEHVDIPGGFQFNNLFIKWNDLLAAGRERVATGLTTVSCKVGEAGNSIKLNVEKLMQSIDIQARLSSTYGKIIGYCNVGSAKVSDLLSMMKAELSDIDIDSSPVLKRIYGLKLSASASTALPIIVDGFSSDDIGVNIEADTGLVSFSGCAGNSFIAAVGGFLLSTVGQAIISGITTVLTVVFGAVGFAISHLVTQIIDLIPNLIKLANGGGNMFIANSTYDVDGFYSPISKYVFTNPSDEMMSCFSSPKIVKYYGVQLLVQSGKYTKYDGKVVNALYVSQYMIRCARMFDVISSETTHNATDVWQKSHYVGKTDRLIAGSTNWNPFSASSYSGVGVRSFSGWDMVNYKIHTESFNSDGKTHTDAWCGSNLRSPQSISALASFPCKQTSRDNVYSPFDVTYFVQPDYDNECHLQSYGSIGNSSSGSGLMFADLKACTLLAFKQFWAMVESQRSIFTNSDLINNDPFMVRVTPSTTYNPGVKDSREIDRCLYFASGYPSKTGRSSCTYDTYVTTPISNIYRIAAVGTDVGGGNNYIPFSFIRDSYSPNSVSNGLCQLYTAMPDSLISINGVTGELGPNSTVDTVTRLEDGGNHNVRDYKDISHYLSYNYGDPMIRWMLSQATSALDPTTVDTHPMVSVEDYDANKFSSYALTMQSDLMRWAQLSAKVAVGVAAVVAATASIATLVAKRKIKKAQYRIENKYWSQMGDDTVSDKEKFRTYKRYNWIMSWGSSSTGVGDVPSAGSSNSDATIDTIVSLLTTNK